MRVYYINESGVEVVTEIHSVEMINVQGYNYKLVMHISSSRMASLETSVMDKIPASMILMKLLKEGFYDLSTLTITYIIGR